MNPAIPGSDTLVLCLPWPSLAHYMEEAEPGVGRASVAAAEMMVGSKVEAKNTTS